MSVALASTGEGPQFGVTVTFAGIPADAVVTLSVDTTGVSALQDVVEDPRCTLGSSAESFDCSIEGSDPRPVPFVAVAPQGGTVTANVALTSPPDVYTDPDLANNDGLVELRPNAVTP